jgi:hypothetical protein
MALGLKDDRSADPKSARGAADPEHRGVDPEPRNGSGRRLSAARARLISLVRAIEDNDDARIEEEVLRLSRSRRTLAPLAFAVSAIVLLFKSDCRHRAPLAHV